MTQKLPVALTITKKVITALEGGVFPWVQPWSSSINRGTPTNLISLREFRGVNAMLLNSHAEALGFKSKWWATEKYWMTYGGKVKTKPKYAKVASWGMATRPNGTYYFNVDQVHSSNKALNRYRYAFDHNEQKPQFNKIIELIEASEAPIEFGADEARYDRTTKTIECPHEDRFETLSLFFMTLLHEVGHWLMDLVGMDNGRPTNELTVELMSCFLGSELGIPIEENLDRHVAYLDLWLKEMKVHPNYIILVSRDARRLANYLLKKTKSKLYNREYE